MAVVGGHVRLWARTELRRRWLSLVLLGLMGGSAAGLTMAAYDGAQRSSTAYERMRQQLHGADAVVFPSQVRMDDFDPRVLGTLPEVESWGGFSLDTSSIDGVPPFATPFITSGADWFSRLEGAKVLDGRLPDPARDDEAVLTAPALAQVPALHVGARVVWRNLSVEQDAEYPDGLPPDFDWATAKGVVTTLTIVGVVRLPMESVVSFASDGLLLTGPGWAAAHLHETPIYFTNALVRLRHGAADLPRLRADLQQVTGRSDIPVKDVSTDVKRVQRSLDVEHTALLMFAAAVAIAAVVLVGQAIARATSSGVDAVPALRAMGVTGGGIAAGLALPMVVTVASTAVGAAAVSVVAARWFPIGLARKVDPVSGVHLVWRREALGLGTAVLVVSGIVVSVASLQRRVRSRRTTRTRVMSAATRAGVPVPPALGASLAVDASPEHSGRSRLALLAAVAGVVSVVGALTLVHAIDDLVDHPARAGASWDLVIAGVGTMTDDQALQLVEDEPGIADVAIAGRVATSVNGFDIPVYDVSVEKGSMAYTVLRGRGPRAGDEIAFGPATLRSLHVGIGDTVTVGPDRTTMRVVGTCLLPQTPHSSFDEGGWVSSSVFEPMFHLHPGDYSADGIIGLADGVSVDAIVARLPANWDVEPPPPSPDLANLVQVRRLPIYFATFLAALALGAVAHALFTGARQRARELAIMRALGLTGRQAAACVSWQAIATGVVATLAGLPFGVLAGRRVWAGITEQLSFVYIGPPASVLVVVAVPACLLGFVLLAIVPAHSAARDRIVETLRQE